MNDLKVLFGEIEREAIDANLDTEMTLELRKDRELQLLREAVERLAESVAELVELKRHDSVTHQEATSQVLEQFSTLVENLPGRPSVSECLDAADRLATDIGSAILEAVPAAEKKI